MRAPLQKLTRDEALREIETFIVELDAGWQKDGLDWAPELLIILREFCRVSQVEQLLALRTRLHHFLSVRRLKGISFLLTWADAVVESYEKPVA